MPRARMNRVVAKRPPRSRERRAIAPAKPRELAGAACVAALVLLVGASDGARLARAKDGKTAAAASSAAAARKR
ncbi:MAG TPA: hypothetical protein VE996_07850 [Terriglobales bacterium]|nr:hypothetical protein [Terriglobales bacterium]